MMNNQELNEQVWSHISSFFESFMPDCPVIVLIDRPDQKEPLFALSINHNDPESVMLSIMTHTSKLAEAQGYDYQIISVPKKGEG